MEYTKQPITLAEQINILKQRGLIFEDEEHRSLLSRYPMVQPSMMGFPRGWENEPLWQ